MKLLKYLPIAFIILFQIKTFGQSQNGPAVPQPIPPSPNAASLGKYGDIPIGKYTGIPDISIPLYTIEEGDIKVPISLSYHASGVKVEENASWVGLGWSLNAGGVITRSVRGKPDESGYLNTNGNNNQIPDILTGNIAYFVPSASTCDLTNAVNYIAGDQGNGGGHDTEPDMYYFNFNGMSGKFVLDNNGVAYTIPYQKIKIQRLNDGSWTITTMDGMIYNFGIGNTREYTAVTNVNYTQYNGSEGDNSTQNPSFESAWYLSNIKSPMGKTVNFNYVSNPNSENFISRSGFSQYITWDVSDATSFSSSNHVITTGSVSQIQGVRLSNITFSNGSIDFVATQTRDDIVYSQGTGCKLLSKIALNDKSGIIKNFVFNTDYFTTADAIQDATTKRLRLNSITEWNGDMTKSKAPYQFAYDNSAPMPSKISSSQDHWGYYNGKVNIDDNKNPTLIPDNKGATINVRHSTEYNRNTNTVSSNIYNHGVQLLHFNGANRSPDFNFAKIGVLNKITYPTGGYTVFEYEPHDYDLKAASYVHDGQTIISKALAVSDPDYNSVVPVDDRMESNYQKTRNIDMTQYITSANNDLNKEVFADLKFSFNNGGRDFYNCGFSEPVAVFKDVTINKILIQANGREGDIYIDDSIQSQINLGDIMVDGNFQATVIPNTFFWNIAPYFNFSHVKLDPTHTYQLQSTAYYAQAVSCESRPGVPYPPSDPITNAWLQMSFYIKNSNILQYNGTIGGLRIKKISDYNSSTSPAITKQYSYRLSSNPLVSSGGLLDWPVYLDEKVILSAMLDPSIRETGIYTAIRDHKSITITSGSKFELGQTSGSFIGYKEVKESYCSDGTCTGTPNGFKWYRYTSSDDYPDINTKNFFKISIDPFQFQKCGTGGWDISWLNPGNIELTENVYPYPPKLNYDWKRGLPISEETYDQNQVLKRKQETNYNFILDLSNSKVINALKVVMVPWFSAIVIDSGPGLSFPTYIYYIGRYGIVAGWNYKTQDKVTDYDNNGNAVVTTTNYFYDNPDHALLTRTETTNSKGEVMKQVNKYVGDEASITGLTTTETAAIAALKAQFRYPLLEKDEYRNSTLMNLSRTGFKIYGNNTFGNSLIQPESIKMQIGTNPIETRLNFQNYDLSNGNILQYAKTNGPSTSFIWGYNKQYPIAQASNAKSNNIFFDSFEEGNGNIGTARTGHYGFSGIYSKPLTGLDAGSYTLSYWQLVNGTWVLVNTPVTVTGTTYTIKLTGQIDDVRFYPVTAQMTTYTYDPLIGETSVTDPKGEITYYEYDTLQRLLNIKDKDGNIIKHIDYHYMNQ